MQKIIFITFADSKYQVALERIKTQVDQFSCFTERYYLSEKDLDLPFRKKLNSVRHPRGFGYWRWKPYIVKQAFDRLKMDDILVYSDVGNWWNKKAFDRFTNYIEIVNNVDSGLLVFTEDYAEKKFTKGDLFEFLNVYDNPVYTDTEQIWSGCLIFRKTKTSIEVINKWNDLHMNHYDLTTDKKSIKKNFPEYLCHRHDQSTLSLIVKSYSYSIIEKYETVDPNGQWDLMGSFPIQARRSKKRPDRWLSFPRRFFLGLYLMVFEKMRFNEINTWWY